MRVGEASRGSLLSCARAAVFSSAVACGLEIDDAEVTDDAVAGTATGPTSAGLSSAELGLILGGGIAVIVGIIGGTFWYIRRLSVPGR